MANKKKILVVDDETDILEVVPLRLKASGFDVITASNGEEALLKFANDRPDAILLDILMPGMDGIEVLKKIRKTDADIPVFITTAFASEDRLKAANELNATGFILKTGNIKEHIGSIEQAILLAEKYRTGKK